MSAGRGSVIRQSLSTFFICVAMSAPLYFLAVWSYATAFWQTADSNMKGWLFILFPMLLIPPFIPWLKIALVASFGFALPHPITNVLVLVGGLFFAVQTDVTGIGDLSPAIFRFGILLCVGIGAWLAHAAFAKRNTSSEAETNA